MKNFGKTDTRQTGRIGEQAASDYLSERGHMILRRNWRSSHLELDIISLTQGTLHIVEVKTRKAPLTAAPEENITREKKARMVRAAKAFLHSPDRGPLPPDLEIVFDVMTVVLFPSKTVIHYYPGAFVPIYI